MLENRIKLRHLSCFLEVAAQRSFVLAADLLNLTQPAVSKAIAELEDELMRLAMKENGDSEIEWGLRQIVFERI